MEDELATRRKRRRPSILCSANSKQTGKPCQNPPAPGQTVCRFHGGHFHKDKVAKARVERELHKHLPPEDQWRRLDPLEAADLYRAEADAWLATCRRMVEKLDDFEVTSVLTLDNGKTVEKVGAEVRAIVQVYQAALDRAFGMATTALKLGIAERYTDQLERNAQLFARVIGEGMRLLNRDLPPERYAAVIPLAIEAVQREAIG
jgi:hypothetical protein